MLVHTDACIIVVDICAYRSFSGQYFDLRGHGYEWDGTAYTTYSVSRQIQDFTVRFAIARILECMRPSTYHLFFFRLIVQGTEAIDGLSCQHTTAAINAKLAGELAAFFECRRYFDHLVV